MLRVAVWRTLSAIPLLLLLSLLAFLLLHLVPGSVAGVLLKMDATPEAVAALEAEMGLDDPLPVQYTRWLWAALQGDLGVSLGNGQPVAAAIGQRIGVTLSITLGGMLLAVTLGVSLGILAALYPQSLLDRGITVLTSFYSALPSYFMAMLLVLLFAIELNWLPAMGYTAPTKDIGGWLQSIILPCIALGLSSAAWIARQTRSAMLGVMQSTYIRAARASGIPFWRIVRRHALRNALIPVVTIVGLRFSVMLGIAFVVEQVFGMPGIGELLVRAVLDQDITVVQGGVMAIGLLVIGVNTLVDVSYAWLNPKVRLL